MLGLAVVAGSAATPAAADTYRYDVLGRLIRVTYTNGAVVHYAYDAAGNRTTVIADPTGTAPPPASSQGLAAPKDSAGVTADQPADTVNRGAPPVEADPAPGRQGEASSDRSPENEIRHERGSER